MPGRKKKGADAVAPIVPFTATEAKAVQTVFDSVPVRELQAALIDSGDPRALQLAERLSDSAYSRTAIAHQCYALKLNPKDIWQILIDSRRTEARLKISEALVDIAATVTQQAVAQEGPCPRCSGSGMAKPKKDGAEPDLCSACHGTGVLVREGDKESQKMALEMGELLNQKVPLIAQQFNSYKGAQGGVGGDVPDMADWSRESDDVFEEKGDVGV